MKFVIYTPPYDENSGGILVLHKLADVLQKLGHEVSLWYMNRPHISELNTLTAWKKLIVYYHQFFFGSKNKPATKVFKEARYTDIRNAVVVYPEIVNGNPLSASRVVRWLLNKPGQMSEYINYGKKDLFFYFDSHFNDTAINPHHDYHLKVIDLMGHVYNKTNHKPRDGTCFMIRKGKAQVLDEHEDEAKLIDGMSHKEIASEFNRCKYFVSYDVYTMYSVYAAMCGCIPIVVPAEGVTKEEWHSKEEDRYGVAYGWDDIAWAITSRERLISHMAEIENQSVQSVSSFVSTCEDYFQ